MVDQEEDSEVEEGDSLSEGIECQSTYLMLSNLCIFHFNIVQLISPALPVTLILYVFIVLT